MKAATRWSYHQQEEKEIDSEASCDPVHPVPVLQSADLAFAHMGSHTDTHQSFSSRTDTRACSCLDGKSIGMLRDKGMR